ncbi:MAG: four helix bundle protein [Acidobacteria bacterium]|nr:MAG: four helix bundle protein [Acidobacteriota bacterium]
MALVTEVYKATGRFPAAEMYGLTSQIRRAAVSVPSNIAEGQGREGSKEFRHFLAIAKGSLQELRTQIRIAQNLGFLKAEEMGSMLEHSDEVARMPSGLLTSLKERSRLLATNH